MTESLSSPKMNSIEMARDELVGEGKAANKGLAYVGAQFKKMSE